MFKSLPPSFLPPGRRELCSVSLEVYCGLFSLPEGEEASFFPLLLLQEEGEILWLTSLLEVV